MKILWSGPARKARAAIIDYIAQDNPHAALELLNRIEDAVSGLADFPFKGRVGKMPETRELILHPNYLAVYAVREKSVYIVTLLHASQVWPPSE